MKKFFLPIFLLLLLTGKLSAQTIPFDDNAPARQFPGLSTAFNRIFNGRDLDAFYQKLYHLKKTGQGTVSIVHIGDSHIQAGFLPGVIRTGLQQFFGNAGRGLVFPYQLAQSNAPSDISSSSNINWQFNRLAHPEIAINAGITGYCIRTNSPGASFDLSLKQNAVDTPFFNRLKFFTDSSRAGWILQAENNSAPFLLKKEEGDTTCYRDILLDQNAGGFTLSSLPSGDTKEFYGVSLENSNAGVLYHSIGVNGARYDQYNIASLFWQQLSALHADLYIVSLGTNEAQRTDFDEAAFQQQLDIFIQKLKKTSPGASVLVTTTADSYYKRRRSNLVLRSINISLSNYCNKHDIPLWDLYRISNGYGSAYRWMRAGLMNNDRIHFTGDGYRIQGALLFNALAKGYNNFVNNY